MPKPCVWTTETRKVVKGGNNHESQSFHEHDTRKDDLSPDHIPVTHNARTGSESESSTVSHDEVPASLENLKVSHWERERRAGAWAKWRSRLAGHCPLLVDLVTWFTLSYSLPTNLDPQLQHFYWVSFLLNPSLCYPLPFTLHSSISLFPCLICNFISLFCSPPTNPLLFPCFYPHHFVSSHTVSFQTFRQHDLRFASPARILKVNFSSVKTRVSFATLFTFFLSLRIDKFSEVCPAVWLLRPILFYYHYLDAQDCCSTMFSLNYFSLLLYCFMIYAISFLYLYIHSYIAWECIIHNSVYISW